MTDSDNTQARDFIWHFKCLLSGVHPARMVGSRPDGQGNPAMDETGHIYNGTDAREALGLARKWNLEGLNIYFEIPGLNDCLGCKWIGLKAHVNYQLESRLSIIEHIMVINREEFHGKANILDAGNTLWFFIRLPDLRFNTVSESLKFMKSVTDYCTNLGIKWDRATDDNLAFWFDSNDFFPFAKMPAAGMSRHGLNRSHMTGWIDNLGESPPHGIYERISGAADCMRIMERSARCLIGRDAGRSASVMRFKEIFNRDAFYRLMEENAYFRKLVRGKYADRGDGRRIEDYFDLILPLRRHWSAVPAIIELAITERRMHLQSSASGWTGFESKEIQGAMLAADDCIKLVSGRPSERTIPLDVIMSAPDDLSFIQTSFREYSVNEVVKELSANYGELLHFVSNGWFVLDRIGAPDRVIHVREHPSRVRPYIPFPCTYRILSSMEIRGDGALLVPNTSAQLFWRLFCGKDKGDMAAAIYFWHYGTKFDGEWIPGVLMKDDAGLFHRIMSWLAGKESLAWKVWKAHETERARVQ